MFYGHYKSSNVGRSGCVKEFVSLPQEAIGFPPQVSYKCDLCKDTHGFRLHRTVVASTPSSLKALYSFCETNNIEKDVEVPHKI